jgi:hypothetical protein
VQLISRRPNLCVSVDEYAALQFPLRAANSLTHLSMSEPERSYQSLNSYAVSSY